MNSDTIIGLGVLILIIVVMVGSWILDLYDKIPNSKPRININQLFKGFLWALVIWSVISVILFH